MDLTLFDLERAINYWRIKKPSLGEESSLSSEVNTLASVYALMIFHGLRMKPAVELDAISTALIAEWRGTQA